MIFIFIVLFSIAIKSNCQEIQVDHVISVVSDIEKATNSYIEKGFNVKKGRLHQNGLINAHIKFKNNTSFELISIKGTPTDEIAINYLELLSKREGGVFVAISGITTHEMEWKLLELNIKYKTIEGRNWDYITFPKTSSLAHFFFIDSHITINDSADILTHKNETDKILEIYVEGDDYVVEFLKGIGLKYLGKNTDIDYQKGDVFMTETGKIIVIPKEKINERPRVKAILFGKEDNSDSLRIKI